MSRVAVGAAIGGNHQTGIGEPGMPGSHHDVAAGAGRCDMKSAAHHQRQSTYTAFFRGRQLPARFAGTYVRRGRRGEGREIPDLKRLGKRPSIVRMFPDLTSQPHPQPASILARL